MHMKNRACRRSAFALVISGVLLAGCVQLAAETTPTPQATIPAVPTPTLVAKSSTPGPTNTPLSVSGDLRLAVREDIKTLNPYLASNVSEQFTVSLLYDTLLSQGSGVELRPGLAERWRVESTGVNVTFWLNPLAKWHDGLRVTAQDVGFSFNLAREVQFPGLARVVALVDRVEAMSSEEVKFVLLTGRPDALWLLGTGLRVVPEHLWRNISDPLQYSNLDHPIGSGPFLLTELAEGKRLVLSNARAHYRTAPAINTVTLEVFREEDTALKSLRDGKLDALGWEVAPELAREVRDKPDANAGISLAEAPGTQVFTLLFNLRQEPYASLAFRQALAQAIDTQAIISTTLMGFGDAATPALFPPASPWRDTSIPGITFDPQLAMRRLQAEGFMDKNGDGLRETRDGNALQVPITCPKVPGSVRLAEMIAANWRAVGIGTKVTTMAQDLVLPALMQAQFDVCLHSLSLDEPEMLFFYFHSSRGQIKNGRVTGLNYGGYANLEFDEVISVAQEEQDATVRLGLLYKAQAILAADLPQIPLYVPRVLNLYREDHFVGWGAEPGSGLLSRSTIVGLRPR